MLGKFKCLELDHWSSQIHDLFVLSNLPRWHRIFEWYAVVLGAKLFSGVAFKMPSISDTDMLLMTVLQSLVKGLYTLRIDKKKKYIY